MVTGSIGSRACERDILHLDQPERMQCDWVRHCCIKIRRKRRMMIVNNEVDASSKSFRRCPVPTQTIRAGEGMVRPNIRLLVPVR